ncbi:GNAT family N-acetyltransferase [Roseovarius aestuarii]|nr:GNAT family N-acetyltransferase [Roseovarius aestuarii]
MIAVRRAAATDKGPMATLLNAIIEQGGTTALTRLVTGADIAGFMDFAPDRSAWHVALDGDQVCGFQYVQPKDSLPPSACDIATFVQIGRTGLGIGSALFRATTQAAKALGYTWINANIRADNEGGLIYYQSRGFHVYGHQEGVKLANGQTVDKVLKRYEL